MVLQTVLIILLTVSTLLKAGELVVRRQERTSAALLAGSFAALAAGLALSEPGTVEILDSVAGGLGKIVFNGLTIVGLYLQVVFFLRALHGTAAARRIRWETVAAVATVLVQIVLIVLTPPPYRGHTLSSPYLNNPAAFPFYLVGGAYFVYAYLAVIRLIWVYVRVGRGPLVWALRLIAAGLVGLTLTSLVRVGRVLGVALGGGQLAVVNTVNFQLNLASYLIVSVGLVLAGGGQAIALVIGNRQRRRQYHELEPLWTVITSLYPEIVLRGPVEDRPRWLPESWSRRLYRRVLECRDGLLRSAPVIADAAGTADLTRLAPERIAAHLHELAAGRPPRTADPAPEPFTVAPTDGTGLGGDVDALLAISDALPAASR